MQHETNKTPIKKAQDDSEIKERSKLLKQSLKNDDTTYISEYLLQRNNYKQLKYLDDSDIEKLGLMLLEFLDTPLRLVAVKMLKVIPEYVCNKKSLFDALKNRSISVDKLVYLKGKIDYIKMMKVENVNIEAEKVFKIEE
ncbi:hypothetical protein NAPIS_ORF00224 [Vairimorpha apis BRL 01]|uniref:Uncharacterized protein n=1 Tax=Vairimorpha apis BRL 01 TaxID=1037528 RepID=T0L3Y1_9MICR|nr:hypothetical protein NAPIS_ORF00224 [Vairimorpha apis BRL 01]